MIRITALLDYWTDGSVPIIRAAEAVVGAQFIRVRVGKEEEDKDGFLRSLGRISGKVLFWTGALGSALQGVDVGLGMFGLGWSEAVPELEQQTGSPPGDR